MESNKNFLAIIIGAVIMGGFVYFGLQNSNPSSDVFVVQKAPSDLSKQNTKIESTINAAACGSGDNTIVTKVIDGDTIVVEGGYHIRLLGMDADENGYPCYSPAKIRLEELVLGKQVLLEKDKTDVDQYGRCLRYIFVGNINIDVQLIKEGLAVARFYEPDVKYRVEITEAEKQAEASRSGCKWSSR